MIPSPNEALVGVIAATTPSVDYKAELIEQTWLKESDITPEMLAKYESVRKEIGAGLDLLEVKTIVGVSEKITKIHELLEEADASTLEKTPVEQVADAATQTAEELAEAAKKATEEATSNLDDKAAGYIANKADSWFKWLFKDVPWIWGFMEKFTLWETLKKFFMTLFWGLGIGKFFSGLFGKEWDWDSGSEGVVDENNPPIVPVTPVGENQDPIDTPKSITESLESLSFNRYKAGAWFIYSLNGSHSEFKEKDNTEILKNISAMSYNEILELTSYTQILQNAWDDKIDYAKSLLESYQSEDTQTLLRVWFSQTSLKNIIMPRGEFNKNLASQFWDTQEGGEKRLHEIYTLSQEDNFDWKISLSFKEISILYLSTFAALRIPAIDWLKNISTKVSNFVFWESINMPDIDNYSVLSTSLASRLWTKVGTTLMTDQYIWVEKDTDFRSLILSNEDGEEPLSIDDTENLDRLITFKNAILNESFIWHKKLILTEEQKLFFKEHITYAQVIAMYGILGWNPDLSNVNAIALPVLLYTISDVLWNGGTENSFASTRYVWNYIRQVLQDNSNEELLSSDERDVIKIYGKKVVDVIYTSYVEQYLKVIGYTGWLSDMDLDNIALSSFVGWFWLKVFWNKLIRRWLSKRGVSIPGIAMKRFGYISMLFGAATWAVSWYTKPQTNTMSNDVERALSANNGNGDLDELMKIIQRHEESRSTFTTTSGKEVIVLSYPGDVPFYIFDGKVYGLKVWNPNIREDIAKWESLDDYWEILKNNSLDLISESTGVDDGINYKVQTIQWDNIIFGEWENTQSFNLQEIFNLWTRVQETIWQDIITSFTNWERSLNLLGFDFSNEWESGYIISNIGSDKVLFLAEMWTVNDIFSQ